MVVSFISADSFRFQTITYGRMFSLKVLRFGIQATNIKIDFVDEVDSYNRFKMAVGLNNSRSS